MLIVLEGCDGVGKSTLVEQLVEVIGGDVEVIRHGPPTQHPLDEYEGSLLHYRPGNGHHVVVDRLHLGEPIYGPTYRGKDELGRPGVDHVNLFLRSRGAILVVVTADLAEVERRIGVRGDDFVRHDDLHRILYEYRDWQSRCRIAMDESVYALDTTHLNRGATLNVAQGLVAHAALLSDLVAPLRDFPQYVGPIGPRWLLLGDEPNPEDTVHLNVLPFTPYGSGSGRYLLKAVGNRIGEVGLANTANTQLEHLVQAVRPHHVVALGRRAGERCDAAGIPVSHAPHPQWWRRFRHHDLQQYREVLFG